MFRISLGLLLVLSLSFIASSAPAPNSDAPRKAPAVEEIKKAIEELGSPRFAVREKAKKFLLEAGAVAEPLLEEAAKSTDEEVASTAKSILEKYQWGLYPDTPKAVIDLIEQYRAAPPEQRQEILAQLLKINPAPYATIRKLLGKEDNAEFREQMFGQMYGHIRRMIPQLLRKGDFDAAEEMYALSLAGSTTIVANDYASFVYLRGNLDAVIKKLEVEQKKPGNAGMRAAEVLVYLYRNKGDFAAARKAAEQTKKDDLVERVLWQAADWKALANYSHKPEFGNLFGVTAAYERLAGNTKAFEEKMAEIKKSAEAEMEEKFGLRQDVDALFLNGKSKEALTVLIDKKKELAMTFDILCAQMRHKEAFDLVDEARRRDTDEVERHDIEIRRAKMLHTLGEKDAALQLFTKVFEAIKGRDVVNLARNLIKAEVRVNLRDEAMAHAAVVIEKLRASGQPEFAGNLLEPIFNDNKDIAMAWWVLFRKHDPKEDAVLAMKRVRDILVGKLERKQADDWIEKMLKEPMDQRPNVDRRELRIDTRSGSKKLDAVAAAYRALKDEVKSEEFLRKAAEKYPSQERWIAHGDFLMHQKKYQLAAESFAKAAKHSQNQGPDIEIDDDSFAVIDPNGPALPTYLQGKALLMAGDEKEAKRLIEIAHWLPLGNDVIRAKLVEELNKRDWPEMARKEANMLMKTGWYGHFSYGNVLSYLARQASREKDYLLAADCYEKCVIGCLRTGANFIEPTAYLLVPESVRVYRARGMLAKGNFDEAIKEASASLEIMPGNVDLAVKLVPELEKQNKKKEADVIYDKVRGEYTKLVKNYPNSAFAHNSAAWIMANCRRELDAAMKHAQKATELEPKTAGYIDTLAEVHFRKGDRDKALTLMKVCAELEPKNGYFRKQLVRFKSQGFDSPTPDENEEDDE
ncbi:MAG: hypothetical protein K8T89_05090 [Planctomycetes bacterium]|nr:hypothetical protein [Planctomycetota bacterium]